MNIRSYFESIFQTPIPTDLIIGRGLKIPSGLLVCDKSVLHLVSKEHREVFVFAENRTMPNTQNVSKLRQYIQENNCKTIISFGSGSINDICKIAAFESNSSFICVPTAPSVNGFTSAGVSIINENGHKHSLMARLPDLVLVDLDILEKAPKRLINAGFADLFARQTAQADWYLSHIKAQTDYHPFIFEPLIEIEHKLVQNFNINDLIKGLLISGFGMWYAKGSYPASGSEHTLSHIIESKHPQISQDYYHGEVIAVSICSILSLYTQNTTTTKFINWTNIQEIFEKKGIPTKPSNLNLTQAEIQDLITLIPTYRPRISLFSLQG